MADLIEFLRARLDEDEAAARDAPWELDAQDWPHWVETSNQDATAAAERYRDHFPPTRMLAEVTVKRAIIGAHRLLPGQDDDYCEACGDQVGFDFRNAPWPCATLRLLAQPFAGHSDFDPAWRLP